MLFITLSPCQVQVTLSLQDREIVSATTDKLLSAFDNLVIKRVTKLINKTYQQTFSELNRREEFTTSVQVRRKQA